MRLATDVVFRGSHIAIQHKAGLLRGEVLVFQLVKQKCVPHVHDNEAYISIGCLIVLISVGVSEMGIVQHCTRHTFRSPAN